MTQHLGFTETLAGLRPDGDRVLAEIAPNWSQGRAGFGGLVAALGLEAIRRGAGRDWPLRSLLVAFVGPAMGTVGIAARPLRVGRSAAFHQADMAMGDGVAATVTGLLGPDRATDIDFPAQAMPDVPPPEDCPAVPQVPGLTPAFLDNLDLRMVSGQFFSGSRTPEVTWWVRHRDRAAWGTEAGLVALLDTLPPAAATLLAKPSPMSSLTWMIDFATADFGTEEGWYLTRSSADYAGGGFSGQAMATWSRDGRLLAMHRQSVAIFG